MVSIENRPGWAAVELPETDEHAAIFLVEHLATGKLFKYCRRCGGQGEYSFNLMDGTVCYGCSGRGYAEQTTMTDEVRKAKARKRAAHRRELKAAAEAEVKARAAEQWRAAHGEFLASMAEFAGESEFLADLLAKTEHQPLTERQMDAAAVAISREAVRREVKLARQRAGHLGTVGEKITVRVQIKRARFVQSDRFDRASQYLITMETEEGHVLKTWTSGAFGDEAAEALQHAERVEHNDDLVWTITGTVKAHGDYNDTPETTLTRVKKLEA